MFNVLLMRFLKHSTQNGQEFYSSFPKGYRIGRTKYVVIAGSVISGVGKGTFSSSLGSLLKLRHNLRVAPIKFDGYLNYDAGTLNPYRHGEVFVLDDGTECDLDLGTYERMLNQDLSKNNYLTAGKIFKTIIDKERKGDYLGRDVQFIPHVTGEIKLFLRNLAIKSRADIVLVEVGGTVGDIENSYFLEAMRELAYEDGRHNVCFVNVVYIIEPGSLGEQKSKAAQLGIKSLMSVGIQPNIIVCRSQDPIKQHIIDKISITSNIPVSQVFNLSHVNNILEIPVTLKKVGIDRQILQILNLRYKHDGEFRKWEKLAYKITKANREVTIGITGKYTGVHDSYLSILKALEHCAPYLHTKVHIKWIETTNIEDGKAKVEDELEGVDGIIVPGGFGKRGTEGKIKCVQYAREHQIPYLGLCFGFQMAVIEFARNVCGLRNANSTEIDPNTPHPVIDILPEQKNVKNLGGTMRLGGHNVLVKPNTLAYKLFNKKNMVRMRFRHRFECNPSYIDILQQHGLIFSGKAPNQPIMQILELRDHPYFIGTQAHPCFTSRPLNPNPMFSGLIQAALNHKPYK